ncbi:MAG: hypothetical protein LBR58_11100 [Propionibacteriaceae bacterium]|nr:hypothetical protein [Propionibacteriaceae bacterium]
MADLYAEEEISILGDRMIEVADQIIDLVEVDVSTSGADYGSQAAMEYINLLKEQADNLATLLAGLGAGAKQAYEYLTGTDEEIAADADDLDELFEPGPPPVMELPYSTIMDYGQDGWSPDSVGAGFEPWLGMID